MSPQQALMLNAIDASIVVIDASATAIADAVAELRASLADQPPADTTPPVFADAVTADSITQTSYTLTLPPATDDTGVVGYELSIDDGATWLQRDVGVATITGRAAGTTDHVIWRSRDAAGNVAALALTVRLLDDVVIEPPPLPTGLIKTHGNRGNYKGRTHVYVLDDPLTGEVLGPFDFIDPAKMLPPIPWRIAPPPSCKGVEPPGWDKWDTYGSTGGLYSYTPAIVDGRMVPIYTQFGDEIVPGVRPRLRGHPLRPGPRGVNISHPYITWHGHDHRDDTGSVVKSPHMPAWIGIGLDGVLHYAMYDGAMQAPYTVESLDGDYTQDFCYFEPDRKRFYVVSTGKGALIEVNRPVTTDPSTWTERIVASGFGAASSVRSSGGMLYVADSKNGKLVEVHPDTGAKRDVAGIAGAFWVDRLSNGDLCVATNTGRVFRVSIAGVVTFLFQVGTSHRWITCSVDREGSCG